MKMYEPDGVLFHLGEGEECIPLRPEELVRLAVIQGVPVLNGEDAAELVETGLRDLECIADVEVIEDTEDADRDRQLTISAKVKRCCPCCGRESQNVTDGWSASFFWSR